MEDAGQRTEVAVGGGDGTREEVEEPGNVLLGGREIGRGREPGAAVLLRMFTSR